MTIWLLLYLWFWESHRLQPSEIFSQMTPRQDFSRPALLCLHSIIWKDGMGSGYYLHEATIYIWNKKDKASFNSSLKCTVSSKEFTRASWRKAWTWLWLKGRDSENSDVDICLRKSNRVEIIPSWDAVIREHLSKSNKVKDASVHLTAT